MIHQKHEFYKYLLPLKNQVHCITLEEKKCHNLKNVHFEEKFPQIEEQFFPLWLPSRTLLLNRNQLS